MAASSPASPIRGRSECAELVRQMDWTDTSLGPVDTWPPEFVSTVNTILNSPLGYVLLCGDDGLLIYNDSYARFAGTKHPAILGLPATEAWPEVADYNRDVMRRVRAGEAFSYDNQFLQLKKGSYFEDVYLNLTYSPMFNGEGDIVGTQVSVLDVTSQNDAQLKLEASHAELFEILDGMGDAFLSLDQDWQVVRVNRNQEKLSGTPRHATVGHNFWELFPAARDSPYWTVCHKVMKDRQDGRFTHHDLARDTWTEVDVLPAAGHGLVIFYRDITRRKKLERQKDDFIAVATHELRTPVTSMKTYAQVLGRRFKGDGPTLRLVGKLEEQVDKLLELISSLLDVTKLESSKMQLNREKFDLTKLVAEVIDNLQPVSDHHKLEFDAREPVVITSDKARVEQVITNLVSNAVKYSPRSDKVTITCAVIGQHAQICVRDYGIGIAASKQPYVFERFFRVADAKHQSFPGLGLGLYICAQIVKRLGGAIWVESDGVSGSTFCFRLPLGK